MKRTLIFIYSIILFWSAMSCAPSAKQVFPRHSASDDYKLKARDYYLKGIYLQQEGHYNEALVKFYQALHHDSTSATIYSSIAENHMRLGHFESAELLLRKALSLDKQNTEALSLMGECQLHLKHDDQAIAIYKKLLEIDPFDRESRQYLMLLYEKNNDLAAIARQNEELLQLYGNSITLLERLGKFYFKQKNYERSEFFFNKAIETDSAVAEPFYYLGKIREIAEKQDEAISFYKRSLHINPLYPEVLDHLTFLYRLRRDWKAIIDLYRPMYEADSSAGPAPVFMAESYYYLEEYDKARDLLLPMIGKEQANVNVIELMARIEFQSGNFNDAKNYFREILAQDRKKKFAWLFLAFSLSDLDSTAAAQATFEQALQLFPDDADIWSFYANNLQDSEKYDQAITSFNKALALDSTNSNALTNLPVLYEKLEMFSRCDSLYEIALKRLPDNDLLLNNYSYSLSERNLHLQRALEMVKKALEKKPQNAAYLDTIGWIYYKLGMYEDAEKHIGQSLSIRTESAVVLEHLGDVYHKMMKYDKAREYWLKSLQMDKNERVLKKLKENQ